LASADFQPLPDAPWLAPWGFFDGNLSAVKVLDGLVCVLPPLFSSFSSMAAAKPPSPLVVKLQILGVFCVPLALLGLWLKGKGFW
jgi:hypothetical protein